MICHIEPDEKWNDMNINIECKKVVIFCVCSSSFIETMISLSAVACANIHNIKIKSK